MASPSKTFKIETRRQRLVNTDPQRRCYNGCHARSELQWDAWDWLALDIPEDKVEHELTFWRELNDYSVSVGGSRSEYRAVEMELQDEAA